MIAGVLAVLVVTESIDAPPMKNNGGTHCHTVENVLARLPPRSFKPTQKMLPDTAPSDSSLPTDSKVASLNNPVSKSYDNVDKSNNTSLPTLSSTPPEIAELFDF